jgi:uncharacterized protein (DUF2336 family)
MFLWVTDALRDFIVDHFALDEATVDELLKKAAADQPDTPAATERSSADKLADALKENGKITPDMLVDAMAQGEINLFVSLFGRVTGLPRDLVMRLLFDAKGEGLAVTCKGVGLDRQAFCSLLDLSRKARPAATSRAVPQGGSALALFDATPRKAAAGVLKKWQRHSDYVPAVDDLKLKAGLHG